MPDTAALPSGFAFRHSTRPATLVVGANRVAGLAPALEVLYLDVPLALFTDPDRAGDLEARGREYIRVYGYLAEWRRSALLLGYVPSWSEDLRVPT